MSDANRGARKRMSKQHNGLFSKFMVTQLDLTTYKPLLSFKWLPKGTQDSRDEADENKVLQFCFPESITVLQSIISNITTEQIDYFSFILTNSYGGKSFAYCKRILKEDPVCYIFISTKPYFSLFDQIFTVIESKYERKVKYSINALLTSLLMFPLDPTLSQIEIKASANNSQTENYEFLYTSPTTEFEHISYEPIYNMKPAHVIKLYESILTECRVILCSSSISKISNSILAISSLVNPFSWQHIFISILPEGLMPYVSAPIPFLVGILESSLKSFYQQPTEQVILYNLDKCEFMIDPNFKSLLPVHINTYLENSLKKIKSEHPSYDSGFDKVIRKPFLSVIYHLFQNYPKFMLKNGVSYSFAKDQFIDSHSGSNKKLIETLVCSQMIEMFFNEKEVELADAEDPQQCSFLLGSRDMVDKIQVTSYKRQSVLDCPICMQSTNHHASIEFANYLMHQECFKCKTCGRGLMDFEREKVILKRKDGERIQLYCAECRSGTFLNKLKNTSSHSKQKIYSFFKNLDSEDVNSFFYSSPAIRYSRQQHQLQQMQQQLQQQTKGVNISNPMPLYGSNAAGGYPIIPVKTEIQNYKFKKPPPKDLGGKALSMGRLHPLHNEKSSTLPSSLHKTGGSAIFTPKAQSPPPKISSSSFNKSLPDRQKPPLPPTPSEMKERAVEQFKQKNIHIHGGYQHVDGDPPSSSSSSTNTPSISPSSSFDEARLHNHLAADTTNSSASSANSTPSNTPPATLSLTYQITNETRAMQFSKALPEVPFLPIKKPGPLPPLPPIPAPGTPASSRPLPIPRPKDTTVVVGVSPSLSPPQSTATSPRSRIVPSRGPSPPTTSNQLVGHNPQPPFVPTKKPLPIPKSPSVNDLLTLNNNNNNNITSTTTTTTTTNTTTSISKPPSPIPKLNTPSPPSLTRESHKQPNININNNNTSSTTTTNNNNNKDNIVYSNNVIIPTNNYYTNSRAKPASPRTNNYKPTTPRGGGGGGGGKSLLSPPSSSVTANKSPLSLSPDSSLSPRRLNKHCFKCKVPLVPTDDITVSERKYYHYTCFEKDKAAKQQQCTKCDKQPLHGEYVSKRIQMFENIKGGSSIIGGGGGSSSSTNRSVGTSKR
ncbi:hypothetical protein DFA_03490 [Cavenderia fasciculata]|uniref:UDENN domain-containing protein n=1 Tax=Cavenderia fasciculata TaxID=261658 RepID=F4PHQ8_CACFS|nr:uncharacterized protein DFA_03490 [Cavenderia fasciculata]EGG25242.1 hypothetical protein DFA_03490 [Cavenderia fasciculata]|eukprot:XP_004363093.1 hypothetical protein DFA_03490 [Cavenderia fasciculata]